MGREVYVPLDAAPPVVVVVRDGFITSMEICEFEPQVSESWELAEPKPTEEDIALVQQAIRGGKLPQARFQHTESVGTTSAETARSFMGRLLEAKIAFEYGFEKHVRSGQMMHTFWFNELVYERAQELFIKCEAMTPEEQEIAEQFLSKLVGPGSADGCPVSELVVGGVESEVFADGSSFTVRIGDREVSGHLEVVFD